SDPDDPPVFDRARGGGDVSLLADVLAEFRLVVKMGALADGLGMRPLHRAEHVSEPKQQPPADQQAQHKLSGLSCPLRFFPRHDRFFCDGLSRRYAGHGNRPWGYRQYNIVTYYASLTPPSRGRE